MRAHVHRREGHAAFSVPPELAAGKLWLLAGGRRAAAVRLARLVPVHVCGGLRACISSGATAGGLCDRPLGGARLAGRLSDGVLGGEKEVSIEDDKDMFSALYIYLYIHSDVLCVVLFLIIIQLFNRGRNKYNH